MSDLKFVRTHVRWLADVLPPPDRDSESWSTFIMHEGSRWSEVISEIHFDDSVCDNIQNTHNNTDVPVPFDTFPCASCEAKFGTQKALLSHMRSKHGVKTPMRFYAGADFCCQACKTVYSTRTRLLAHLTDSRRSKCFSWCLNNGTPLSEQSVAELDDKDRLSRRAAMHAGHTNVHSKGAAVSYAGSLRGGRKC